MVWLEAAKQLARLAFGRAGTVRRGITAPAVGTGIGGGLLGLFGGGGDGDRPVRRRRRRALTQSDRNDIAFIAATLGDVTGRKFALVIAARSI